MACVNLFLTISFRIHKSTKRQWLVCKIPLLARALGLKAEQPPGQARAITIGYMVYKSVDREMPLH